MKETKLNKENKQLTGVSKNSQDGMMMPKEATMFESAPRKELANEVIRADCMNHGYRIIKTIGEGAYAKVKLAEVLPGKLARNQILEDAAAITGTLNVAVKIINTKQVPREFAQRFLPREIQNHIPLPPHKNVVRVYENFTTGNRVYVIMEYCERGDLLDLINQKIGDNQRGIGEDLARKIFKQMCEGIKHVHSNEIAHRDLKCENILIDHNGDSKITDFGFSCKFNDKSVLLKTSCGSYAYTAPEVIKCKSYNGFKADIWSMGIILFAMLNGRLPFSDVHLAAMEEEMKMQRLCFERTVSFESMMLVRKILQHNSTQRPSLAEIMEDPWITGRKPIPRQLNKPKWVNPYQGKKEEAASQKAICYKTTSADERNLNSTVTIGNSSRETITLRSRSEKHRKNIWTSGPSPYIHTQNRRPSTWPVPERPIKVHSRRDSSKNYILVPNCGTSMEKREKKKIVGQGKIKYGEYPSTDDSSRVAQYTKWLMEKSQEKQYKTGITDGNNGRYRASKEVLRTPSLDAPLPSPESETSPDQRTKLNETFNMPVSPIERLCPTCESKENLSVASGGQVRKIPAKSASVKKNTTSNMATASRSADLAKQMQVLEYFRDVPVTQRGKRLRERLLHMYGRSAVRCNNHFVEDNLPPLVIQALKPNSEGENNKFKVFDEQMKFKVFEEQMHTTSRVESDENMDLKSKTTYVKKIVPTQKVVLHPCC